MYARSAGLPVRPVAVVYSDRDQVAWVDENLEGFKGRVTRDKWVVQAKILAAGGTVAEAEAAAKA